VSDAPTQRPARVDGAASPRSLALCAGLALAYFAAAKLGLSMAFLNPSASVVWPPTGLSIAAVVLFGTRVWPGVFLGALAANALTAGNLATSLAIACGNTLEGVVGALLVVRFAGGRQALERAADVFRFALLAGCLSPLISATIGVSSLTAAALVPRAQFAEVWFTWWLGDAVGAWIVAPFLIAWATAPPWRWERGHAKQVALLFACVTLAGALVFFGPPSSSSGRGHPLTFLCLPPLVWVAFRLSRREVATAIVLVSTLAVVGTYRGLGAFTGADLNESLLLLQAFLGVTAITSLAVCAVVSEFRRAEDLLRASSRALSRSNADLESFATVASHDLQEPLRMVTSYVHLLERRAREQLGPEAHEYMRHAVSGAEHMHELIDGLLAYSRLDAAAAARVPVDCEEALRVALENSELVLRESGATVEHEPLPSVSANETQLIQLFQNLIGNAAKFRRPGVAPRIRVGARVQDGVWLLSVSDNGIGMDPRDSTRAFVAFQRLHHREDYPGAGIGLAICKRIVENHGGRIWVEARPGEGCTFCFTLPGATPAGVEAMH